MLNKILGYFSHDIGIDLGTANTLVYVKGKGILIREPSVVTMHKKSKEVLAVGSEAKRMLGKTPANIVAIRPLRDGVISDFNAAEKMIAHFIKLVHQMPAKFILIPRPRIVIGVPSGVTSVERRAVIDAARNAGAREVYLLEEPMAAAIGADLDVTEPKGTMIIDMGGGTTEIAVISLGGVVVNKSIRVAGNKIDEGIQSYLKKKHNLIVGDTTAEDIKLKIGSAVSTSKAEKLEISGRDLVFGLPRTVIITSSEVTEAIKPVLMQIVGAVKGVLEDTPPELAADIIDKGIIMSGGSALLRNFDKLITEETGVPAHVADEPLLCVVRGTGLVLENIELWKRSVTTKG